ncbi:hypothetical protein [Aeromicrobium marinum]|uniref:hypothetical protein n=1 Tax=Aeromicrobium marinum TaxID=219314 RepID=UPI00058ADEC1|nr:hypothetical protein [Aeromicrobium marinum]
MRRLVLVAVVAAIVGVAAGGVWAAVAEPADWTVTERGLAMGEDAARELFGVVVAFMVVGLVASTLFGVVAGLVIRAGRFGGQATALVATGVLATGAGLLAWQLGQAWGPPDPAAVTGVGVGDLVPAELVVDTWAAFLVWPVGAFAGVFLVALSARGTSAGDRGQDPVGQADQVVG